MRNVNGAGDGLAAGTIHGLALGHGLFKAVRYGLAAAAIATESDGTVSSELGRALVEARVADEEGTAR